MFRFDDENKLASIAQAENSGIDEDDQLDTRKPAGNTISAMTACRSLSRHVAVESFEVNAELLGSSLAKPLSLSARGLLVYIDYLKRNNLDAAQVRVRDSGIGCRERSPF